MLSERERELLCGPSNSVTTQKRVVVEDIQTGRGIEYRAADSEEGLLSCSSVVNVNYNVAINTLQLDTLFVFSYYSFVGHTRTFAKVAVYDHITEDCDSHLLFVATRHDCDMAYYGLLGSVVKASHYSQNRFRTLDS